MSTIRKGLLEFTNLPWTTNILEADLLNIADKIPELKHLVDALAKEDANPHVNTAYNDLKHFFDAKGSIKLGSKAFDCFFEYRLLDVLNRTLLGSPYIKREEPHLPPVVLSDIAPNFGFKWLEKWPTLITQTIARIENSLLDPEFCANLKHIENDKSFRWTSLCATRATSNLTSTLANLEQAAFYIHHIVRGHRKLPHSIKSLQDEYGGRDIPRLGQEGCSKISLLKAPLHVALVSSSMSLLVPKKISAKSVSNLKFLRAWQELRRSKPEAVDYVETVIWKLIFDAATGARPNIFDSLRADLKVVQRVLAEVKDPEALSWFPPLASESQREKAAQRQLDYEDSDDGSSDENVGTNGIMLTRNKRPLKRKHVATSDSESEQGAFATPEPPETGDDIIREITPFMDVDIDEQMDLGVFDDNRVRQPANDDMYSQDVNMGSDGREDTMQPNADSARETRMEARTPSTSPLDSIPPPASRQPLAPGTNECPLTPRTTPEARMLPTPRATPATTAPPVPNASQTLSTASTSPTPPTTPHIQNGSSPAPEKSGNEPRYPTRSTRGKCSQGGELQQGPSNDAADDKKKQSKGANGDGGGSKPKGNKSTGASAASSGNNSTGASAANSGNNSTGASTANSGNNSTGASAANSGKKTARSTKDTFKLDVETNVEALIGFRNEAKKAMEKQSVEGFRCLEVTDLCEEFRDNIKADPPFENPEGVGLGQRFRTKEYTIPLPDNSDTYTFAAEFHFKKEQVRFEALMKVATKGFHENLPRYISSPQTSRIRVMKYSEFVEKSHEEIAEIFKTHHIVTTGETVEGEVKNNKKGVHLNGDEPMEVDDIEEDDQMDEDNQQKGREDNEDKQKKDRDDKAAKFKQCVESVCDMDRSCTIHDLSLAVKNLDHGSRHTVGTPRDIVQAALATPGKAANGLDNPTWEDSKEQRRHPCSSDCHAWDATVSRPFCHRSNRYPTYPMRWHLISTGGCFHTMHIDSDGVGTIVCVKCGCKIWFIAVPKLGSTMDDLATASIFNRSFDIEGTNAHLFDIEVIILLPGTRYIQKPNTAHAVYTSEPTVVEGSHFYSSATLADTVYGVLHTFLRGGSITNTDNREVCFELLCRLVAYYHGYYVEERFKYNPAHIPSVDRFDGLLDLVRLCIIIELGNALNFWPVEGSLPEPGRYRLIYARKRCRELCDWIFGNFKIKIKEATGIEREVDGKGEVFWEYFAQIACTLLNHARDVDSKGLKNYIHHLERHIVFCFFDDEDTRAVLSRFLHRYKGGENDTFCWKGPQYAVERRCGERYKPDERSGLNLSDQIRGITDKAVAKAAGGWWVS